jgi:hypothetical protein
MSEKGAFVAPFFYLAPENLGSDGSRLDVDVEEL